MSGTLYGSKTETSFCFRFVFFFIQEDNKKKNWHRYITCAGRRYIRGDPVGWQTLVNVQSDHRVCTRPYLPTCDNI